MGGIGSGRWVRHHAKPTTAAHAALDVRALYRAGQLAAGGRFDRALVLGGKLRFVGLAIAADGSEVAVTLRHAAGPGPFAFRWAIALEHTPCTYGGARPWFACPACGRRAAKLYLDGWALACRRCCGLAYATQQADATQRAAAKVETIRRRLGCLAGVYGPVPPRPRYMHQATYDAHLRDLAAAMDRYDALFKRWMAVTSAQMERLTARFLGEPIESEPRR